MRQREKANATKHRALLLISLVCTVPLIPNVAAACDWGVVSLAAMFELNKDIFTATVGPQISARQTAYEPGALRRDPGTVQVVVTERFKGVAPVYAVPNELTGGCRTGTLKEGEEYLFYMSEAGREATPGGTQTVAQAAEDIARLRAYRNGEAPDLSESWGFFLRGQECKLVTWLTNVHFYTWKSESPGLYLTQIGFYFDRRENHQRVRAELPRATLRIEAINPLQNAPEFGVTDMSIQTGSNYSTAAWTTDQVREYVDEDGTIGTSRPRDSYLLEGQAVIEIIRQLRQTHAPMRLHVYLRGRLPDVDVTVPTSQLGDAAAQMLDCIQGV
jgi:hypothetical protein